MQRQLTARPAGVLLEIVRVYIKGVTPPPTTSDQGWEFDHRFFAGSIIFCDRKINVIMKTIESLPLIF